MNLSLFLLILVSGSIVLGALAALLFMSLGSGGGGKASKAAIEEMNRGLQAKLLSLEEFTSNLKKLINERESELDLLKKTEKDLEEKAVNEIAALKERTATQSSVSHIEEDLGKIKRAMTDLEQKLSLEISTMRQMPVQAPSASTAKLEEEFAKLKKSLEAIGSQPANAVQNTAAAVETLKPAADAATTETLKPPVKEASPKPVEEPPKPAAASKPVDVPPPAAPKIEETKVPEPAPAAPVSPLAPPALPKEDKKEEKKEEKTAAPATGGDSKAVSEETVDDILALLQGKKKS